MIYPVKLANEMSGLSGTLSISLAGCVMKLMSTAAVERVMSAAW
jgi:hypothetical protein